jgi:hypothetical protein
MIHTLSFTHTEGIGSLKYDSANGRVTLPSGYVHYVSLSDITLVNVSEGEYVMVSNSNMFAPKYRSETSTALTCLIFRTIFTDVYGVSISIGRSVAAHRPVYKFTDVNDFKNFILPHMPTDREPHTMYISDYDIAKLAMLIPIHNGILS